MWSAAGSGHGGWWPSDSGKPLPSPASASTSSAWKSFPSVAQDELCGGETKADLTFDARVHTNYRQPFCLFACSETEVIRSLSTVLSSRLNVQIVQPGKVLWYFAPF